VAEEVLPKHDVHAEEEEGGALVETEALLRVDLEDLVVVVAAEVDVHREDIHRDGVDTHTVEGNLHMGDTLHRQQY